MKSDQLLEIFYKHLKKCNSNPGNAEEFIHNIVADYMFYLMNQGHIPTNVCDALEIDLKEEVQDLYQKLISGPIKKVQQTINAPTPSSKARRLN